MCRRTSPWEDHAGGAWREKDLLNGLRALRSDSERNVLKDLHAMKAWHVKEMFSATGRARELAKP